MNQVTDSDIPRDRNLARISISSPEEASELASDLADDYVLYFTINADEQRLKYEDSIEECLTHLEEVCSVLESYGQNGEDVAKSVEIVANKRQSLDRLCRQIDALEQYVFEMNSTLDNLDSALKGLECQDRYGSNRVRKLLGLLPRFSLGSIPRLGILDALQGIVEDPSPTHIDNTNCDDDLSISVDEILQRVANIVASVEATTSCLLSRLNDQENVVVSEPILSISDTGGTSSQVDGSWQELL